MEKRRPTYDLEAIKKALGSVDRLAITVSAFRDASSLGFDRKGIVSALIEPVSRGLVRNEA